MGNVERHRRAHDEFNRGAIESSVRDLRPDATYTDCARGITMKSREDFADWLRTWRAGFSDAQVSDRTYIDAGDVTICQFTARATHDGTFGPLEATGRRIDVPFCEIFLWGDDGTALSGDVYYDQMTILVQLGIAEPPPSV